MKRLVTAALMIVAASSLAFSQKPAPNPPAKSVVQVLKAAGNFNTFLGLLEQAGIQDESFRNLTQAGPGGGPRTILAPNDDAFAKLPKGTIETLRKDPKRLRSFLLGHMLTGKVMVKDMFDPVENSNKEFKTAEGRVLGFSCNGRHAGMHNPTINGRARVGKFQDVVASGGVVHEIEAVLITDGTSR